MIRCAVYRLKDLFVSVMKLFYGYYSETNGVSPFILLRDTSSKDYIKDSPKAFDAEHIFRVLHIYSFLYKVLCARRGYCNDFKVVVQKNSTIVQYYNI